MTDSYDAHRDLEQKALRKVRGLVDKLEADERAGWNVAVSLKHLAIGILLFAAAAATVVVFVARNSPRSNPPALPATASMSAGQYAQHVRDRVVAVSRTLERGRQLEGYNGRAQVTMTIRPNGSLQEFKITRSSWDSSLDGGVLVAVKVAEPFGPLPDSLRAAPYDVVANFSVRSGILGVEP